MGKKGRKARFSPVSVKNHPWRAALWSTELSRIVVAWQPEGRPVGGALLDHRMRRVQTPPGSGHGGTWKGRERPVNIADLYSQRSLRPSWDWARERLGVVGGRRTSSVPPSTAHSWPSRRQPHRVHPPCPPDGVRMARHPLLQPFNCSSVTVGQTSVPRDQDKDMFRQIVQSLAEASIGSYLISGLSAYFAIVYRELG